MGDHTGTMDQIGAPETDTILREAGENYLEAILRLEDESHHVRSIDVANTLGVSRPSVNKALGVLKKAGMVEQQPYGRISLTGLGRERAQDVLRRHVALRTFLTKLLGVDAETADADACRMEHVISEQTMAKLCDYMEKITEKKDPYER